jgi:hypothetical protein
VIYLSYGAPVQNPANDIYDYQRRPAAQHVQVPATGNYSPPVPGLVCDTTTFAGITKRSNGGNAAGRNIGHIYYSLWYCQNKKRDRVVQFPVKHTIAGNT